MTGDIKFYKPDYGYGFITSDQAGDVFFHVKDCRMNEAELQPGMRVEFEPGEGRRGMAAFQVTPIGGEYE